MGDKLEVSQLMRPDASMTAPMGQVFPAEASCGAKFFVHPGQFHEAVVEAPELRAWGNACDTWSYIR